MSVISHYRTKIRLSAERMNGEDMDPTWRLMGDAVEAAAQEYGGKVTDRILDAYGRPLRCDFALVTPSFPRGVGVKVGPEGDVTFVYDPYDAEGRGYRRFCAEITEHIVQNYTALAVAKALGEMNYSVEVDEAEEGPAGSRAVVVRGSL